MKQYILILIEESSISTDELFNRIIEFSDYIKGFYNCTQIESSQMNWSYVFEL